MIDFVITIRKENFDNLCGGVLDHILVRYQPFYTKRLLSDDLLMFKRFDRIVINKSWVKRFGSQIIFEHKETKIISDNGRRYIKIYLGKELARG